MASNRGFDSVESKSRLKLIEAAFELLGDEGHEAISARRIAEKAGLKPQLVHYYFRSMEELVVEVFRLSSAHYARLHDEALSTSHPMRALWELNRNQPEARRVTEFISLGKQYPVLRTEMREAGARYRAMQIAAFEPILSRNGIDETIFGPAAVAALLSGIARTFVIESGVDMTMGHTELTALVERLLDRFDPL
jgi:AcrR family transcriptional regulator